jgi:hypothetical protein
MIYVLLCNDSKKRVWRSAVTTFRELLEEARIVKQTIFTLPPKGKFNVNDETPNKPKKTRCSFCNIKGHDTSVCRKRIAAEAQQQAEPKSSIHNRSRGLRCYGCGKPRFVRKECSEYNEQPRSDTARKISFCAINANFMRIRKRPAVNLSILGIPGTAFLDTGARISIGSHELEEILVEREYPFQVADTIITLADGKRRNVRVRTATVPITLASTLIDTTLVFLPNTQSTKTFLRVDFLANAGIVKSCRRKLALCKQPLSEIRVHGQGRLSSTKPSTAIQGSG